MTGYPASPTERQQAPAEKGALEHALDFVELIGRLEMIVVPSVATEEMCMRGALAAEISPELAARVYNAMVHTQD